VTYYTQKSQKNTHTNLLNKYTVGIGTISSEHIVQRYFDSSATYYIVATFCWITNSVLTFLNHFIFYWFNHRHTHLLIIINYFIYAYQVSVISTEQLAPNMYILCVIAKGARFDANNLCTIIKTYKRNFVQTVLNHWDRLSSGSNATAQSHRTTRFLR
jgi:hypothetical protein